jgi:DNA-binding NarL/FixJ family response regulator
MLRPRPTGQQTSETPPRSPTRWSLNGATLGRRRRDDPIGELSAREREVLELMAEGLSNSAIAARLFLTDRGVEKHVTSIFQKLHLPVAADTHRRVLAVIAFLQS